MYRSSAVPPNKRIFVGNLKPTTTKSELRDYFSTFGKMAKIEIMTDHQTGASRGFGFLTFDEVDSAEKVLGQPVHKRKDYVISIDVAVPRGAEPTANSAS